MMTNDQIADVFEEMADLLELSGENPFRVRAYHSGAKAIRGLGESVASILSNPKRKLTDVEGIGETLAEKTRTLVETGSLPALEKLRSEIPGTLIEVMRVPGLGAKKAATLFRELGVTDLQTLREACEAKKVEQLKGFGVKTQTKILEGLEIAEQGAQRLLLDEAYNLVERLRSHLATCSKVQQLEFAGSYRRGKETIGDIDILVVSSEPNTVMDVLETFAGRSETIQRGEAKMSIRTDGATQVDLRVIPANSWGAALQYFTGSKEHNVKVRSIAKRLGLRINEYGVYRSDDDQIQVAGETEESVYSSVGLPWIPPELRENHLDLEHCKQESLPQLIEPTDIRGDLHSHTNASDGTATMEAMADAAIKLGYEYIAVTDHSKRVSMARGLDSERLIAQWNAIDEIRTHYEGKIAILKGVECDILENGEMDIDDATLSKADWVLASIHYGQNQSRDQITDRILNAIRNPFVNAIAHPTGRLLGRRKPYEVDLEAVIQAAVEFGKALELNANPHRLDLNDVALQVAKAAGVPIVINTDAHDPAGFGQMIFGILQARRAGLERRHVLNEAPWDTFRTWLTTFRESRT